MSFFLSLKPSLPPPSSPHLLDLLTLVSVRHLGGRHIQKLFVRDCGGCFLVDILQKRADLRFLYLGGRGREGKEREGGREGGEGRGEKANMSAF